MFNWFKRKSKKDLPIAGEEFLCAEEKLRKEGWICWIHMPPYGLDAVYARRTLDETVKIIEPKELSPYFNVANLWWIPHRHEIEIINPRLLN